MGAWALGLAVLGTGLVVYEAIAQAIGLNNSPRAWLRIIGVIVWGLLATVSGQVISLLYKSGQDLTILLVVCAAAVTVGCIAGRLLERVGEIQVVRRGKRAFRHVMAEREAEREREWDGK